MQFTLSSLDSLLPFLQHFSPIGHSKSYNKKLLLDPRACLSVDMFAQSTFHHEDILLVFILLFATLVPDKVVLLQKC